MRNILLLPIIVLLFSCNTAEKSSGIIEIQVNPTTSDSIPLSTIIKSIEYIPLENHPDALMGRHGSPRFHQDRIFIASNSSIYCFNMEGKYLYRISRKGKGPGEYRELSSYIINDYHNQLEILCRRSRKILRFDLESGSFIEEINLPTFAVRFELLDANTYVLYTRGTGALLSEGADDLLFQMFLTDRNTGSIVKKFFPGQCVIYNWYPFLKADSKLNVCMAYNDTIYSISKDTVASQYVLDFGKYSIPPDVFHMNYEDQLSFVKSDFISLLTALESQDYFLFNWGYKNRVRWHLWSKKSGRGINFKAVYDDLDGLERYISFKRPYNNKLVATHNSIDILEQDNIKDTKVYQKLIDKGWVPDEESNTVIALYEISFK